MWAASRHKRGEQGAQHPRERVLGEERELRRRARRLRRAARCGSAGRGAPRRSLRAPPSPRAGTPRPPRPRVTPSIAKQATRRRAGERSPRRVAGRVNRLREDHAGLSRRYERRTRSASCSSPRPLGERRQRAHVRLGLVGHDDHAQVRVERLELGCGTRRGAERAGRVHHDHVDRASLHDLEEIARPRRRVDVEAVAGEEEAREPEEAAVARDDQHADRPNEPQVRPLTDRTDHGQSRPRLELRAPLPNGQCCATDG